MFKLSQDKSGLAGWAGWDTALPLLILLCFHFACLLSHYTCTPAEGVGSEHMLGLCWPHEHGRRKHFSFGQAKYSGGIIAISVLDSKMDWNCGMDYGIKKYFYQPATREARGQMVLRLLCGFRVCWYVYTYIYIYASALITCAIITSRTLLPCDLTSVDLLQFWHWLSICTALTLSSTSFESSSIVSHQQINDGSSANGRNFIQDGLTMHVYHKL